ncbi:hypothetical protein [Promicromonospora sp. NPDC090134]|uniref:hypothetical protein n=1 Tax=Promicromonospora sp. NPDC090134 TaxID=3364408 RepID=UPI00381F841A
MRRYKIALLLGMLALSATACGAEPDDGGVASANGEVTESTTEESQALDGFEEALAYSECMRENGITDFPDPEKQGEGGISIGLPEGLDPESEEFKTASDACVDLQPGPDENTTMDPETHEELVEYAECMRTNGITEYPDPEPGGGMVIGPDMGFDTQSDEFQAAEDTCEDIRPESGGDPEDESENE